MLSRYGWRLDTLLATPCNKFRKLLDSMQLNQLEESREAMMPELFTYWLENHAGSRKGLKFDKLLEKLGIIETPQVSRAEVTGTAKRAVTRAEQIRKADKQRHPG